MILRKYIVLISFVFLLLFSLVNITRISLIYFIDNITIRESFLLQNNIFIDANKDGLIDHVNKGINEGGTQYRENFYKNFSLIP